MDFTCPHCHKTFSAPTRRGSKSEKVKEAARRNGQLGGGPRKTPLADLQRIFAVLKPDAWTGATFHRAIEKAFGVSYSRAQAFALLKRLKSGKPERARLVSEATAIDKVPSRKAASQESSTEKKKLVQKS